jgi:hypothetical protein
VVQKSNRKERSGVCVKDIERHRPVLGASRPKSRQGNFHCHRCHEGTNAMVLFFLGAVHVCLLPVFFATTVALREIIAPKVFISVAIWHGVSSSEDQQWTKWQKSWTKCWLQMAGRSWSDCLGIAKKQLEHSGGFFWRLAALLARHRSPRICSSLAPCQPPKFPRHNSSSHFFAMPYPQSRFVIAHGPLFYLCRWLRLRNWPGVRFSFRRNRREK